MHNQVLWPIVLLPAEVRLKDILRTGSVALLRIERGTGHVWHGGVASAPVLILSVTQWVLLGCGLWEPDVTTVATELAGLERLSDVLLHDNGAAGCVDEP